MQVSVEKSIRITVDGTSWTVPADLVRHVGEREKPFLTVSGHHAGLSKVVYGTEQNPHDDYEVECLSQCVGLEEL